MKEEIDILSKELAKELEAIIYHANRAIHYLKGIQIQVEAQKPVPAMPTEPETRCKCDL